MNDLEIDAVDTSDIGVKNSAKVYNDTRPKHHSVASDEESELEVRGMASPHVQKVLAWHRQLVSCGCVECEVPLRCWDGTGVFDDKAKRNKCCNLLINNFVGTSQKPNACCCFEVRSKVDSNSYTDIELTAVETREETEADAFMSENEEQEQQQQTESHIITADPISFNMVCTPHRCQLWWSVTLLLICAAFLFADTNLVAPNLSAIATEFNMTNIERDLYLGGYLGLGFFLLGAPASFLVGFLTDKV